MYDIQLERIYTPVKKDDGARILTDRLWPRGKRREDLALTDWYPHASPSAELRRNWHQKQIDDARFASLYRKELQQNSECLIPLMRHARQGRLTLLTASRDPRHSHLPDLRTALLKALNQEDDADKSPPSSPTCYG